MATLKKEAKIFLKQLLETPSQSGFEAGAQRLVADYLRQFTDKVETDVHGNVIAVKNPSGKPRIMLAAHCDEVGFQVKYITDEGFIYFHTAGAPYLRSLHAQRVTIVSEKGCVPGVIARKKITASDTGKSSEEVKIQHFWIDIGAKDRKEAEKLVCVGDPVSFAAGFQEIAGGRIMAKGFDDKIGVFVIAETMRHLNGEKIIPAVFAVSTVQEEVGSRGAWTSAFNVNPDVGIVPEVIETSDYPDSEKRVTGDIRLGKGPGLQKGSNINPALGSFLIETARKAGIPYQIDAVSGPTSTDASVIQIMRGGVATALLRIPLRYMHTSGEIICTDDVENAIKLLTLAVKEIKPDICFIPV
jgi:tetrahedral aminopeptidase